MKTYNNIFTEQGFQAGATDCSTWASLNAFDTCVSFRIEDTSPEALRALQELAQLCEYYEELFSRTRPTSWLSRLRKAAPNWLECPAELVFLIKLGIHYSRISEGRFNIAIGAVSKLWDFKAGLIPKPSEIDCALPHVSLDSIELHGNRIRLKDPETVLDLGGIAKGYIADKLSETLKLQGFTNHLLNLGGNVIASGQTCAYKPWSVGIKNPFDPSGLVAQVEIDSGSVVSSGIYERSFVQDGSFYHHILDPRTGYPYETDLASVSLVCKSSLQAEGYSSTVLAAGFTAGTAFVQDHPEITEAFLITRDDRVFHLRRS